MAIEKKQQENANDIVYLDPIAKSIIKSLLKKINESTIILQTNRSTANEMLATIAESMGLDLKENKYDFDDELMGFIKIKTPPDNS